MRGLVISFLLFFVGSGFAWAHQPVMDMAPRWKDGKGFQVRYEWRQADDVINDDSAVNNPMGRKKRVSKVWLEGVYTFKREARVTFKMPWVDQSRTVVRNGVAFQDNGTGWGDLQLAVPLKKYFHSGARTGNWSLTPQLRLPTGSTDDSYPVGDGSTDVGISLSFSTETPKIYQLYDVFYWENTRGRKGIAQGDQWGMDINWGWHAWYDNAENRGLFLMWDTVVRYEEEGIDGGGTTGGFRLGMGPILVLYDGPWMFRTEYRLPIYQKVHGEQVEYGHEWTIGLGRTF